MNGLRKSGVYTCNEILNKEGNPTICDNMDGPGRH